MAYRVARIALKTFSSAALAACTFVGSAQAYGGVQGFIEAASRADIAYDTAHGVLYISGDDSLRRFDMRSGKFLDPIVLGGKTMGMDISPDGKTLAVANLRDGATVDLINLDTGASSRATFALPSDEGSTFTVAYDQQGQLLATGVYNNSSWSTLRKLDPVSLAVTVLGVTRYNSMLGASADRSVIGVADADESTGSWGVYRAGDTSYVAQHTGYDPVTGGTSAYNFEIGVSRDGSQIGIPTYRGLFVGDETEIRHLIGERYGSSPIGIGYSPVADRVFLPFADSNELREYDTQTQQEVRRFLTPGTFEWTGNHSFVEGRTKVAADGSYVFTTLDQGIFFAGLGDIAAPVPEPATQALMLLGLGLVGAVVGQRAREKQRLG